MREKAESGLQLIARWTDESGIERERVISIGEISQKGSFVIEIKPFAEDAVIDEPDMAEWSFEEHLAWLHETLPKNTRFRIEKNTSDYYNVMKAYWDYFEYQTNETEQGE